MIATETPLEVKISLCHPPETVAMQQDLSGSDLFLSFIRGSLSELNINCFSHLSLNAL